MKDLPEDPVCYFCNAVIVKHYYWLPLPKPGIYAVCCKACYKKFLEVAQ